ncbi:hypothetical protein KZ813_06060 [Sphingomonas sp. RHCKR7]|uniref:hypothetical protein n=1 Tax=Sphingomonas folli TaxID=2862497 RepID=UPI001CA5AF69|nr:hypothetical protein [Sphingomonas folli]MBW6526399.1 hypothetical protein [Sphingomonas folli]
MAEVEKSDGKVLVDVERPKPCCMTLEASEAIDLAQQLIAVAITVEPPAGAAAKPPTTREIW